MTDWTWLYILVSIFSNMYTTCVCKHCYLLCSYKLHIPIYKAIHCHNVMEWSFKWDPKAIRPNTFWNQVFQSSILSGIHEYDLRKYNLWLYYWYIYLLPIFILIFKTSFYFLCTPNFYGKRNDLGCLSIILCLLLSVCLSIIQCLFLSVCLSIILHLSLYHRYVSICLCQSASLPVCLHLRAY